MTTSGDIATVDTKLPLGKLNKIPEFSSYLDKINKSKQKKKSKIKPTETVKTELSVFKQISEEYFYNLQNIIRRNNVDIKQVTVDDIINENSQKTYQKTITFYSESDCNEVFNGFLANQYEVIKINPTSLVFKYTY